MCLLMSVGTKVSSPDASNGSWSAIARGEEGQQIGPSSNWNTNNSRLHHDSEDKQGSRRLDSHVGTNQSVGQPKAGLRLAPSWRVCKVVPTPYSLLHYCTLKRVGGHFPSRPAIVSNLH